MTTTLAPQNLIWGFYGTMDSQVERVDRAWDLAFTAILDATGCSPEGVRDFLDSRNGRHFADEVSNHLGAGESDANLKTAIRKAVTTHMNWKINSRTTHEHGIPTGLPYLVGWVAHYEILAFMSR